MMRPQPLAFMRGSARRMAWKGADRLTARASSQWSGAKSSTEPKYRTTALFTRMSATVPGCDQVGDLRGSRRSAPW